MEEMIAEHRVKATVDECYVLAEQVSASESILVEFTGELDEDSGGFRSMTCDIQVEYSAGIVRVGSLDFLELAQGGALFQVYEMIADGDAAARDEDSGSPGPTDRSLVRRMMDLVLSGLLDNGLLA